MSSAMRGHYYLNVARYMILGRFGGFMQRLTEADLERINGVIDMLRDAEWDIHKTILELSWIKRGMINENECN